MSSINNVERFRKRLEENKICVGTSVQLCDPLVSELAAEAGNDFLWIEMEHSHMGLGVWSTPCGTSWPVAEHRWPRWCASPIPTGI